MTPLPEAYRTIPLTQGLSAVVDAADYAWLSQYKWFSVRCKKAFYAATASIRSGNNVFMHRLILGLRPGDKRFADHRNGDSLDNRRANLRFANYIQNAQNRWKLPISRQPYKGVEERNGRWRARIRVNRTRIHLGCFGSAEEANQAYQDAARKYFGEFVR